jgi:membrane associated rhomboid family serine protease
MLLIPYKDENPTRHFPLMTLLIIAANVAVFLYEVQLAQAGQLQTVVQNWAVLPRDISRGIGLEQALDLLRSMFLHGSWLHLLGNMLFLYIFGDNVEDVLGGFKYLLFYLVRVAASLAQIVFTPAAAPIDWRSGAIASVLGAYAILYPGAKVKLFFWFLILVRTIRLPALIVLGGWFVFQFLSVYYGPATGFVDAGVAYAAHIGGFVAGIVMVSVLTVGHGLQRAFS